jgi:hypothetical protein
MTADFTPDRGEPVPVHRQDPAARDPGPLPPVADTPWATRRAGRFDPGTMTLEQRRRLAWIVAIATDVLQWIALPAFAPGFASPATNLVDIAVGVIMVRLLGWHWAFLPTFVAELIPFGNLAPTWTIAVLLATRGGKKAMARQTR